MSKETFEWFDSLEELEVPPFDPVEQLKQDYERLSQHVEDELLTVDEANEMYELCRQAYGITE